MKNLNFKVSIYKFSLILPITLLSVFSINAQTTTTSNQTVSSIDTKSNLKPTNVQPDKDKVYTIIEKMPMFPGGENALLSYIGHNLKYPVEAQQKGIQGRILVRFVVNKLGKVENAEVIRGLETNIDKEGLRVVNSLPNWIPGEQKGEKVSVYYTLPITFKLVNTKPSTINPNNIILGIVFSFLLLYFTKRKI